MHGRAHTHTHTHIQVLWTLDKQALIALAPYCTGSAGLRGDEGCYRFLPNSSEERNMIPLYRWAN